MSLEPLAIPPGRALRAESIDVIVWGIHDRRPPWGFQVSAYGSQDERSDVRIRPTNSIPNEMDRHIRRFPPAGSNPSDSIPLMLRDELFLLEADFSVSARGRTGSLLQSQPIHLPVLLTTDPACGNATVSPLRPDRSRAGRACWVPTVVPICFPQNHPPPSCGLAGLRGVPLA
jgi:hypothetical protein